MSTQSIKGRNLHSLAQCPDVQNIIIHKLYVICTVMYVVISLQSWKTLHMQAIIV